MIAYTAVLLVVLVVLWSSYRALGSVQPLGEGDQLLLLQRILAVASKARAEFSATLIAAGGHGSGDGDAAAMRKQLSGCQHQLESLAGAVDAPDREGGRELLENAIGLLIWAARMIEGGSTSEGVTAAATTLVDHAGGCLQAAALRFAPEPAAVERRE